MLQVRTLLRTSSATLIVALLGVPCLNTCEGWTASSVERMACCADGHDQSQDAADRCCATGEGRRNAESSPGAVIAVLPAPAPVPLDGTAAVPLPRYAAWTFDNYQLFGSGSDRHILLSVFLI